jgi:hypothetical protein
MRRERLQEMQRDKEALMAHYAAHTPEALDVLKPEERHQLYRMFRLTVTAYPGGGVDLTSTH